MTRRCRWLGVFAAVLFALPLALPVARAQTEPAPRVGIIDIQAVLRESTAVQRLSENVETQRDSMQEEIQEREEALRAADLDLAQRRTVLSPQDYTREREKLEAEGVALQRELQEQRRQLDQLFSQGMTQVQRVLLQVSQDIARENDLDVVLAKTTVIIVRPEYDYTGEALARLNAQLPDIELTVAPDQR